ncbi:hypothetical protein [Halostagnicola sp. A-GB9-2]|uniref:hypothetical protein n=1 Tax=Halostagnicola sp. A-GB9-2 TaxID=3048066 RepID=UPI0024C014B4|nr:hypothetical protein [Halostagnicola sp. A-GB9-2]MDJ1434791.1 hypothetical protein [Halostagnicola sp. A-GB9-2]
MSTTSPTSDDDHVSPANAFDRLVWHNPRVCNGCFEHVKELEEHTFSGGITDHDVHDQSRTPQATLEQDERIVDTVPAESVDGGSRPGQQRAAVPRTTCRSCSRIGCWADDTTLTKIQALRLIGPLAHRLREQGLEFDKSVLRRSIRKFKEIEAVQGYDTEIFRRSVKLAVLRAAPTEY